jgi:hypothetical protein
LSNHWKEPEKFLLAGLHASQNQINGLLYVQLEHLFTQHSFTWKKMLDTLSTQEVENTDTHDVSASQPGF